MGEDGKGHEVGVGGCDCGTGGRVGGGLRPGVVVVGLWWPWGGPWWLLLLFYVTGHVGQTGGGECPHGLPIGLPPWR